MGFFDFLTGNSTNQLQEYLQKKPVILDVRTQGEYHTMHIQKALHIPLQELEYRAEEIKKLNKPVIVYCASGIRSAKAAKFLNTAGIDAINGGSINKVRAALEY